MPTLESTTLESHSQQLMQFIRRMANPDTCDDLFRVAVAALDAGDIGALQRLIAAHPTILSARLESPGRSAER